MKAIPMHRLEMWWLRIGLVLLVAFFVIIGYDAFSMARGTPTGMDTIDPQKVATTPPFDKPGVTKTGKNAYTAVVYGYAFGFTPSEIDVPVGAKVHFEMTTTDVVHGFYFPGTAAANAMLIPGYVTHVDQVFREKGRFLVLCHEYCGSGHQFMAMHVNVK